MRFGLSKNLSFSLNYYKNLNFNSIRYCNSISNANVQKDKTHVAQAPLKILKEAINEANLSVEKYSLSRGLALNKFEKDFFIFPEFNETEDVEEIKRYCAKLKDDLEESLRFSDDNNVSLNGETLKTLLINDVFRTFIPKEYGGLQFCLKKQIKIFECLGIDFSVFQVVNNIRLAIQLLTIYGTEEQKKKYLSGIAENLIRPAICIYENDEFDFANMQTEVVGMSHDNCKLNGSKINVINGGTADLFFILSKKMMNDMSNETLSCYIVSKDGIDKNKIKITKSLPRLGLKAVDITDISFTDVTVKNNDILGGEGMGIDIANEIIYRNKLQFSGAVIGFMKNTLESVSSYCNKTLRANCRLSDLPSVQKIISDFAMDIYSLESTTYYIGGLIDENLMVLTDIEENVINRMVCKILRQTMGYISEISGLSNSHGLLNKEKICADIITLLSMNNAEMNLIEQISLSTYYSWTKNNKTATIFKSLSPLKALLLSDSESSFKSPKPIHYIAEHVHPSLQNACMNLENTMARLNILINKIVKEEGKNIQADYHTLQSLANIIEINVVMSACISRASRSYSIGLRNADLELAWTTYYCNDASKKASIEMESLMEYLNFIRINPVYINIGGSILNSGKYLIESPIERNW
uniref:Acyl-CoA_dh_N domain-containing protein n=1 Tax=Parastrongyloides trichosuri TaxID=131310 RepID=A0A0N4ZS24_PARTI